MRPCTRHGWSLALIAAAGCGRVAFDRTSDSGATSGDGAQSTDDVQAAACDLATLAAAYSFEAATIVAGSVRDTSGNGRHGTIVGSPPPTVVPGVHGDALDFSGTTNAHIDLSAVPLDGTPGAYTSVSLWFRHDDPGVDEALVALPTGPSAAPPRYDLWLNNRLGTNVTLCINGGLGECWGVADNGLIGRWVHVVVVFYNGLETNGVLYIDGARVTMACRFGTCDQSRVAMSPLELGTSDNGYSWHGLIDDVRIYNRALSALEAQLLFTCGP